MANKLNSFMVEKFHAKKIEHAQQEKEKYLLDPESKFIGPWDVLMTLCLLFTSVFRPYQVAFNKQAIYTPVWNFVNILLEMMFLMDMLVVFNTAYHESEFKMVKDRKSIAKRYLQDQFLIDFTALLPLDYLLVFFYPEWDINRIVLLRLYKMVRVTRLFKVYYKLTDLTKQSAFRDFLNIDISTIRLSFFGLLFFLMCHFTACLWVIIAQIYRQVTDEEVTGTWLDDFDEPTDPKDGYNLYIVSIYWTITTITTVGYGDISATNMPERIFCSFVMLLGVFSFSIANGSLSQILNAYDHQKVEYQEKIEIVDKLQKKYNLPSNIYKELKQNIGYDFRNSNEEEKHFLQALPQALKNKVSLYIFEDSFKDVIFFKNKPINFISWICLQLQPVFKEVGAFLYIEGERASSLHFVKRGQAAYVLPSHNHTPFVTIEKGYMLGSVDIEGSAQKFNFTTADWMQHRQQLQRQFTVRS